MQIIKILTTLTLFTLASVSNAGIPIKIQHTNKCFGKNISQKPIQANCSGTSKFVSLAAIDYKSGMRIMSENLCLQAVNRNDLFFLKCNNSATQKFVTISKSNQVQLQNVKYRRCLDIKNASRSGGAVIGLESCHKLDAQGFNVSQNSTSNKTSSKKTHSKPKPKPKTNSKTNSKTQSQPKPIKQPQSSKNQAIARWQGSNSNALPPMNHHASGHVGLHGTGDVLLPLEQDALANIMLANNADMPTSINAVIQRLEQIGAYNGGQNTLQKKAGAYLALNVIMKFTQMPPSKINSQEQAMRVYGSLKIAAVKNQGNTIRKIIWDNGGHTYGFADKDLVNLWDINEHDHLHSILFGNPRIYNPIHATSLNDRDKRYGSNNADRGKLGGFNDKGEHPQWDWYKDGQTFNQFF